MHLKYYEGERTMKKKMWWHEYSSWELCKYNSQQFYEWWDTHLFDWKNNSWALAEYCSAYFNIWWDSEKYNWKDYSWALAQYCSEYFNIWWNPEKFEWNELWSIELYCYDYFSELQLQQLFFNSNLKARKFAIKELNRRKNDKRGMVE